MRFPHYVPVLILAAVAQLAVAESPEPALAAVVAGKTITAGELQRAVGDQVARLRSEEYALRRSVLERLVEDAFVDAEAQSRGMQRDALLRTEVEGKVVPPTEQETRAIYDATRERHETVSEAEGLDAIRTNILEPSRLQTSNGTPLISAWTQLVSRNVSTRAPAPTGGRRASGSATASASCVRQRSLSTGA